MQFPCPSAHAGGQKSLSLTSLLNAMLGKKTSPGAEMTFRERIDFTIVTLLFSTLLAASVFRAFSMSPLFMTISRRVNTFAILTAGILVGSFTKSVWTFI
jgi:FLVCR family MFS transporter 7